jgi:hypothetical protein
LPRHLIPEVGIRHFSSTMPKIARNAHANNNGDAEQSAEIPPK